MKTKSNCASDGSVTLANGYFFSAIVTTGDLRWDISKLLPDTESDFIVSPSQLCCQKLRMEIFFIIKGGLQLVF